MQQSKPTYCNVKFHYISSSERKISLQVSLRKDNLFLNIFIIRQGEDYFSMQWIILPFCSRFTQGPIHSSLVSHTAHIFKLHSTLRQFVHVYGNFFTLLGKVIKSVWWHLIAATLNLKHNPLTLPSALLGQWLTSHKYSVWKHQEWTTWSFTIQNIFWLLPLETFEWDCLHVSKLQWQQNKTTKYTHYSTEAGYACWYSVK